MAVTRKQIMKIVAQLETQLELLENLIEQKQEVLDNAESVEYPNEDRIDALNEQINLLEEGRDSLQEAIDNLMTYE